MKKNIVKKMAITRIVISLIIIFILIFPLNTISISLPKYLLNGIYINSKYIIAGILFIFAAATNIFVGSFSKKKTKKTTSEEMLDSIANKILINSTIIILSIQGFIHPALPVVIIIRDIITNSYKTIAATENKNIEPIKLGKYKTICLMLGIVFTLFYNLPFEIWGINISGYLLITGTILAIFSGIQYYNVIKKFITKEI